MGESIFEQEATREFIELNENPDTKMSLWDTVLETEKRIARDQKMASIFGQYWQDDLIKPAQVYQYAKINYWMQTGQLTIVTIPFGQVPSADSEIVEMNEKLQLLPFGITAKFYGGLGDSDGYIEWGVPLELNLITENGEYRKILNPGYAQLEVGFTSYTRSFWHLFETGILARWPYDHKNIYLIAYSGKLASECIDIALEAE
jgi:hypothetical protein